MRILFISNVYPNPIDPLRGVFNHYLARSLAIKHQVTVVSPISWVDELKDSGRRLHLIPRRRAISRDSVEIHYPRYWYPPKLLRSAYGWFFWRSIAGCVRRIMKKGHPDVVVSFWAHPDGESAVRTGQIASAPSVVIVGGSDVILLANYRKRCQQVTKVLQSCDAVVAVSSDLVARIRQLGVSPQRIHLWSRGVDETAFSPGDRGTARTRLQMPLDDRVLLWVGSMLDVKGLDVLLDACSILKRESVLFRLYLVGDGPLRKKLELQSRSLGLSSIVTFAGPKTHDELPHWYRAANLFVLPSRSEGTPNVLRESIACGIPFVASRVGGIPDFAAEHGSCLVPPNDPSALARGISEALASGISIRDPRKISTSLNDSAESLLRIIEPLLTDDHKSCIGVGECN